MSFASSKGTASVKQVNYIRSLAHKLGIHGYLEDELAREGVKDLSELSMFHASRLIKEMKGKLDGGAP